MQADGLTGWLGLLAFRNHLFRLNAWVLGSMDSPEFPEAHTANLASRTLTHLHPVEGWKSAAEREHTEYDGCSWHYDEAWRLVH